MSKINSQFSALTIYSSCEEETEDTDHQDFDLLRDAGAISLQMSQFVAHLERRRAACEDL